MKWSSLTVERKGLSVILDKQEITYKKYDIKLINDCCVTFVKFLNKRQKFIKGTLLSFLIRGLWHKIFYRHGEKENRRDSCL